MNRKQRRAAAKARPRHDSKVNGPTSADVKLRTALSHHHAGRLAEAERIYGEILSQDPKHPRALHFLGVVKLQKGDAGAAAELIGKAVAVKPDYAEAYSNLGVALKDQGKLAEAKAAFRKTLELKPDDAEAHGNLGALLKMQGAFDEAVIAYRKVLEIKPRDAEAATRLGALLIGQSKLAESEAAYRKALEIRPNYAEAHNNLGVVLKEQGNTAEAEAAIRNAVAFRPDYAEAHKNLGTLLKDRGKPAEAEAAYRRTLELKPDDAEAYGNLGIALTDQGRLAEAEAAFRKALELRPDYAEAHSNLLFALHYGETALDALFNEHLSWTDQHGGYPRLSSSRHERGGDRDKRLRVGYVSGDFRHHSVSYFVEPLFAAHDRQAFAIFCYSNSKLEDATTARLRGMADGWRNIATLDDGAVVDAILADGIDILVDLSGHTAKNRLQVFARKPVPVQVTWLGYPDTTGLAAMDYRLTDAIADPPGASDDWSTERLVRLPNGFHCYRPPDEAPEVAPSPRAKLGHVTFSSFNNLSKITPAVVAAWAQILKAAPGSRLLVKNKSLTCETVRRRYLSLFEDQGVAPNRLTLLPFSDSTRSHLAAYDQVDIALDTFPYNGTTTTCEALWMGVPVITARGDRHAARVGASLLTRVGLESFIAEPVDEYVETAVTLASEPDRLETIRLGMRDRMQNSPLCDPAGFARDMEEAFRSLWQEAAGI